MKKYNYVNWDNGASASTVRDVLENSFSNISIKNTKIEIKENNWIEEKDKNKYYYSFNNLITGIVINILFQNNEYFQCDYSNKTIYSDIPINTEISVVYKTDG